MIALGTVVIIGGGCYGSFYAGQLERARSREALTWQRVLVVDRDPTCAAASQLASMPASALHCEEWEPFLDRWLGPERAPDDQVVPSPLMPHLMAHWLTREAQRRWPDRPVAMVPASEPMGTPFDRLQPVEGVRYVSWADWMCPVHCIEPATCPAIGAPRTWEMSETVARWTTRRGRTYPTAGPALFACRHMVYGVGMYPARAATDAMEALAAAVAAHPDGADLVIGSVSACHGAVGVLRVGARRPPGEGGG